MRIVQQAQQDLTRLERPALCEDERCGAASAAIGILESTNQDTSVVCNSQFAQSVDRRLADIRVVVHGCFDKGPMRPLIGSPTQCSCGCDTDSRGRIIQQINQRTYCATITDAS
jgi:hypothetical protein